MDQPADPGPASDPAPKRRQATVKELRERIELVRRELLTGKTRHTIQLLIIAEWGIKVRTARWYLRRAEAEIREAASRDKDAWLAEHIALRRDLRRRANAALDLRTELAAAESEAKLLGLEPPQELRHQITGKDDGPLISEIIIEHHILTAEADPTREPVDTTPLEPAADAAGGEEAAGGVPPGPEPGVEVY